MSIWGKRLRQRLAQARQREAPATRTTSPSLRGRKAIYWMIAGGLGVCVALAAVVQTPSTLVAALLSTEAVQFRVTAPGAALMALPKARWVEGGACLEDVLVEPEVGSKISYTRPGRDALQVYVDGKVKLHFRQDKTEVSRPLDRLTLELTHSPKGNEGPRPGSSVAKACAAGAIQRLPVEGDNAVFGTYPLQLTGAKDVALRLLSGQLTVYGRARSHVFGIPIAPALARNALYKAGEITLPGGTVIDDKVGSQAEPGQERQSAIWSGFADVDFHDSAVAITVQASTNAGTVKLFLPTPNMGADTRSSDPETVSLSLMARVVGDPNLLLVYGLLGLIPFVVGFMGAVRDLVHPKTEET